MALRRIDIDPYEQSLVFVAAMFINPGITHIVLQLIDLISRGKWW